MRRSRKEPAATSPGMSRQFVTWCRFHRRWELRRKALLPIERAAGATSPTRLVRGFGPWACRDRRVVS